MVLTVLIGTSYRGPMTTSGKYIGLIGMLLPNLRMQEVWVFNQPKVETRPSLRSSIGDSIKKRALCKPKFLTLNIVLNRELLLEIQLGFQAHPLGKD